MIKKGMCNIILCFLCATTLSHAGRHLRRSTGGQSSLTKVHAGESGRTMLSNVVVLREVQVPVQADIQSIGHHIEWSSRYAASEQDYNTMLKTCDRQEVQDLTGGNKCALYAYSQDNVQAVYNHLFVLLDQNNEAIGRFFAQENLPRGSTDCLRILLFSDSLAPEHEYNRQIHELLLDSVKKYFVASAAAMKIQDKELYRVVVNPENIEIDNTCVEKITSWFEEQGFERKYTEKSTLYQHYCPLRSRQSLRNSFLRRVRSFLLRSSQESV